MTDLIRLPIQDITHETKDAITIKFGQPVKKMSYISGQFLTVIQKIDGKEYRRAYSLSSSPYTDDALAITVKRIPGGIVSNYLNDNAKIGDAVQVLAPMGNFFFKPKLVQRHIVLIGGGSGITPLFSILKSALNQEHETIVYLVYANKSRDATIFCDEIEKWQSDFPSNLRVVHYWSDEQKTIAKKQGFFSRIFSKENSHAHRLTVDQLKTIFKELQIQPSKLTEFYICGPEGLITTAEKCIHDSGFAKEVVFKESFGSSVNNSSKARDNSVYKIKIIIKGTESEVEVKGNKCILYAGLDSGLDMPYSCQTGNCSTCIGKCISGKVEMSETSGLNAEQIEKGYILTCVGYPMSNDVVIKF